MLASVEGLVCDMDGVLWRGPSPLPGVAQLLGWLRGEGATEVTIREHDWKLTLDVADRDEGWVLMTGEMA